MLDVGYVAAFGGGVLTLVSPCGALLLPSFFAYAFDGIGALVGRTVVFALGLMTTLVPLGAGASLATGLLFDHRQTLVAVAGWSLVGLGLLTAAGGGFGSTLAGRAQGRVAGRRGVLPVYGLGAVYGFAGFCSGPILGAVLTVAATDGRPGRGAALLAVYALGMAVPMFLLAFGWDRWGLGRSRWLRGREVRVGPWRGHTTTLLTGSLFVGLGAWFLATDGTGGGLGPSADLETEVALQSWIQRVDAAVPDLAILAVVGVAAAAVLLRRLWARTGDRTTRR